MQEHQLVAVLGGVEVHVVHAVDLVGQRGQLEIVRREQRERVHAPGDVAGAGPGQRQAVVGAGPAADLVHQHQAGVSRVVQDDRSLGHLDHERGAPPGEVVGRTDTREHAVERA